MTIKFAKFPWFRFNSLSPFDVQTKAVRERERHRDQVTLFQIPFENSHGSRFDTGVFRRTPNDSKFSKSRFRSVFPV